MNSHPLILGGARTPMGNLLGSLSSLSAVELGAVAIREALNRSDLSPDAVDEVIMGCVLPHALKGAPAKQASIEAGLNPKVPCTTINKMCGSGMKALMFAHDSIKAGTNSAVVAGGMESMSNAPHLVLDSRKGTRLGHGKMVDAMFHDGLEDPWNAKLMGEYAQMTADRFNISRSEMDEYATLSAKRALEAHAGGMLRDEIVPVRIPSKKETLWVDRDEQPAKIKPEKIPLLKPAFAKDGTVTAANSSCISDGASALVVANADFAERLNLKAHARISAHSTHACEPAEFTLAPAFAVKKLLEKLNWKAEDVDLFEINEAFAVVVLYAVKELGLDLEKVNVFGGACAQGHPVGSSGSRITLTLLNALRRKNRKRGVAAICIGGGEATAIAVEIL